MKAKQFLVILLVLALTAPLVGAAGAQGPGLAAAMAPAADAQARATAALPSSSALFVDVQPTPQPSYIKPTPTPPLEHKLELEGYVPQVISSAPPNDDFDAAKSIASFPYTDTLDTTGATVAADDPNMGCGAGVNSNTVWYRMTTSSPGSVHVDTLGSNYDTVLAAFVGSRGALDLVTCNDDAVGLQSEIGFRAQPGITYYIEVADYGSPGGGVLQLNVEFRPVPEIDVPLDIVLLQDETGSMGDDIGTLRRLAPEIWDSLTDMAQAGFRMSVVGFRDFARSPWGDTGDWVYRLIHDFTTSKDEFVTAVNELTASGGNDTPESQYVALYYAVTPSHPCIDSNGDEDCSDANDTPPGQQPSFRTGAKRIILLATDAPFHDPEDTPGYPGPTRNTVVDALRSTNTTIVGLAPGGAGRIPEVDDLATATGGSVQNTGASGQDVAEAIAAAIGEFRSRPGSSGALSMIMLDFVNTAQPLAPTVRVDNPTGTANAYTVIVSLLQNGSVLDTQSRDVTVSGGNSKTEDFNFGTRPAGSYRLRAGLWLGDTLLSTKTRDITVLDPGAQRLAEDQAGQLKSAVQDEFDQMTELAARATAESTAGQFGLGFNKLQDFVLKHVVEFLNPILDAAGLPHGLGGSVVREVEEQFTETSLIRPDVVIMIREYAWRVYQVEIPGDFDPLHPVLDFITDATVRDNIRNALVGFLKDKLKSLYQGQWSAPEMDRVVARDEEFATFIATHPFTWQDQFNRIFEDGRGCVSNIVEADPVRSFKINVFGKNIGADITLRWQEEQRQSMQKLGGKLDQIAKALTLLVIIVGTVLVLLALVSNAGLSAPAIAAGAIQILMVIKKLGFGAKALVWLGTSFLTIGMILTIPQIAPHVTDEHDNTLDAIEALIGSTGQALTLRSLKVESVAPGHPITLEALAESSEPGRSASPLASTVLYSVDGRTVACRWAKLDVAARQAVPLAQQFVLPRGGYKAVTALHSADQFAMDVGIRTFAVDVPDLRLIMSLNETRFTPGQAVHVTVDIANTHPVSGVSDLILIVESSDGEHFNAWPVSLDPGASQHVEYTFVPQTIGSYIVRASVLAGLNVVAQQDMAYVVGEGAALAINAATREVYEPGLDVTLPITVTNAGTVPTTTVLSLVTLDRMADLTPVYTDTLTLTVAADNSVMVTGTALPAALAQPGQYTFWLYLGAAPYASHDFAVAAQDTLFANVYPDSISHSLGATVPLTVEVTTSTYAYTDTIVSAVLWRPDGVTETISLSHIDTGRYRGDVTAPISGTYLVNVTLNQPGYRTYPDTTFFVAGDHSRLLPTVDGRPILGTTRPVTVTVRNEQGAPIAGASVVVSGTLEYLSRQTDGAGQAVLQLSPIITEPYQISLEKLGFATTLMDLPVWVAPDTTPPPLFLDVPSITNRTPLTVTGLTEAGASLTINSQAVTVDAQGRFTTTVVLSEGANLLEANATDAVSNTTTVTRTVTLDTVPPPLEVTNPMDGLFSLQEVISVTGSTEVGASLTVSGTRVIVDPISGAFSGWILLRPGVNIIPVIAVDEAGNRTTISRTVTYSYRGFVYLPLVLRNP